MDWKPTKEATEATRFLTYEDACQFAHANVKGWPAWRVTGHTDSFYIELQPKGPWLTIRESGGVVA